MSSFKPLLSALCLLLLAASLHAQENASKGFEQWMAGRSHLDPGTRGSKCWISRLGKKMVPELVQILRSDPDAEVRAEAVLMLGTRGIRATDRTRVVDALGYCVGHDDQNVIRYEAANALARFGSEARRVVPQLVEGLGNRSTFDVRDACIRALIEAGVDEEKGPAPRVTDGLLARLDPMKEPADSVRLRAVVALGALGQPRDPKKLADTIAALKAERYHNSPDKTVRIWSRVSLMALENKADDKDLKTIVDYLNDDERDIRVQAAMALGTLQEKARKYTAAIVGLLEKETDVEVIMAACDALGRIGDRSAHVLKALIKLTQRKGAESTFIVQGACKALAQIGESSAEVRDALQKVIGRRGMSGLEKDMARWALCELRKHKADDRTKSSINQK